MMLFLGDIKTLLPEYLPIDHFLENTPCSAPDILAVYFGLDFHFEDRINYEQVTVNVTKQPNKKIVDRAFQLDRVEIRRRLPEFLH